MVTLAATLIVLTFAAVFCMKLYAWWVYWCEREPAPPETPPLTWAERQEAWRQTLAGLEWTLENFRKHHYSGDVTWWEKRIVETRAIIDEGERHAEHMRKHGVEGY